MVAAGHTEASRWGGRDDSIIAGIAHTFVSSVDAPAGWSAQPGAVFGRCSWPLAVFVTMEMQARVAWLPGWRSALIRHTGILTVALVAAVVSYRHMSGLLAFYGEDRLTVVEAGVGDPVAETGSGCVIGPIAIDVMVMATSAHSRADRHHRRPTSTFVCPAMAKCETLIPG